ncbi:MAG: tRNA-dihydrouridine synthase [Patescibacteria group bacterium]
MKQSFWKTLTKPIIALAPMANVTDAAFRRIIAKTGKPDVTWTEFVSADGLFSAGREKLLPDLWFTENERPIVAQFFSAKPELMYQTALLAQELGFDGIDINMGCPDKGVEKQGAGAALMKNPELAKEIILETKRGAGNLPVSVKTRIGYTKNMLDTWLPHLLETEPAAITLHFRTRQEMSKVGAHWELATEAVRIRDAHDSSPKKTLILGNGDCKDIDEAREKAIQYGLDGVMIGRGIFGNPWLFTPRTEPIGIQEKLETMLEHTRLFCELYKVDPETGYGLKEFSVMKKHYKAYASGFDGAKELRVRLMEAKNLSDIETMISDWINQNKKARTIFME